MYGLRLMHHRLRNHFGRTNSTPSEEAQVKARFVLFGDNANLVTR